MQDAVVQRSTQCESAAFGDNNLDQIAVHIEPGAS